mgnify:CR=1 FL=1
MAHDKVYGFCESKCKVEVPNKVEFEELKSETTGEGLVQTINTKLSEIGVVPRAFEKLNSASKTVNAADIVNKRMIYYNEYIANTDLYISGSGCVMKWTTGNQSGIQELGYTGAGQPTDGIWNGHFSVPSRGAVEIEIIAL